MQSYPIPGTKYQVPSSFARQARWRADGKELFFGTPDSLSVVTVQSRGPALTFGAPTVLFRSALPGGAHRAEGLNYFAYDVSSDGQTFVLPGGPAQGDASETRPPLTVILNWTSLLGKK